MYIIFLTWKCENFQRRPDRTRMHRKISKAVATISKILGHISRQIPSIFMNSTDRFLHFFHTQARELEEMYGRFYELFFYW